MLVLQLKQFHGMVELDSHKYYHWDCVCKDMVKMFVIEQAIVELDNHNSCKTMEVHYRLDSSMVVRDQLQ